MEKYALSVLLCQRKRFKKFFNIMRISALLLFVCIFASYASNASSQTTKVNITNERMTIGSFIKMVENETGYMFVYNKGEIDANKTISLQKGTNTVVDCLNRIFEGSGVSYVFEDDYIVLTKRVQAQIDTVVQQSGKVIQGVITDETGLSVIGANVFVKGTTIGTVTDVEGKFSVEVPSDDAILVISYIGYMEQQIPVKKQKSWTIVLKEDSQSLDEVVVVGYGTVKRGNLTMSVSSLQAGTLENRPVQSVSEALQGQVPGLSVTSSGRPGEAAKMQLRGATSLNESGSPLVLVDGVPGEFDYLNVDDIENVTVLKDAASAAIYGSRAAHGVILVTTKRGKTGKPTFRYNGSVGINTPTDMPKVMSSADYARVLNEANANMDRSPVYQDTDIQKFANGTGPNLSLIHI